MVYTYRIQLVLFQAPAEEEDQAYEIDFSIRLDVNIVKMGRFSLAMLLVIALVNPSLSCSKSQNPGEPFEIWSIDLFTYNVYGVLIPKYAIFKNLYFYLESSDLYDDNACVQECAELSPGEHCESSLKQCQCGNAPSCIGTAKPFCDKGECKGISGLMLHNVMLAFYEYQI